MRHLFRLKLQGEREHFFLYLQVKGKLRLGIEKGSSTSAEGERLIASKDSVESHSAEHKRISVQQSNNN